MRTVVVHVKQNTYDVYIGREMQGFAKSKWGNPFKVGQDGTRAEVIDKYEAYLMATPMLLNSLHELKGKKLGCWCSPRCCHGDVLVRLLEGCDTSKNAIKQLTLF